MASRLREQLRSIANRLTAPRSIFEMDFIERHGQKLPAFRHAPRSLPALFDRFCAQHRDTVFLVDGDMRLTFGEVHALARRAATGLIERHGIRHGDRVAIAGCNSANWIIAYMGVLMAGGCAALLNGWWTGEELADGIELADCALVLADPERAERIREQGAPCGIIAFGPGGPEGSLAPILADEDDAAALPDLAGDDLAAILFTSGSTGRSKAAWSDHRAIVQATMSFAAKYHSLSTALAKAGQPPAASQVALLSVPLFHVTGAIATLLMSFALGRRMVVMPEWDAIEAMRLIERERVTFFVGVPLMSLEIASHPERDRYDLSSCETFAAGGAPRPVKHVRRFHEAFPDALQMLGYGLTETNCVGCTNIKDHYLAKPASTGPANSPLVEIAILGPGGEAMPTDRIGEIAIRSICNFRGYWNDPDATRQAVRPDGFLLTGDIGYLDKDGFLFIVDRKKDIIIRGGENISCSEVEHAIYDHPAICEVSVFGLPDERYGEVPVAVYHTKPGLSLQEEDLREHLRRHIAQFKIPVQFWAEEQALPRLGAQKIDKTALKARYSAYWEDARSAA